MSCAEAVRAFMRNSNAGWKWLFQSPMVANMLTIGHSNRSIELFTEMLQAHEAKFLADVRHFPRSRHNPQFNLESLPAALETARIGYEHFPALGGRRRARKDSVNRGWRNASFRGYADYMDTPEFTAALEQLIEIASRQSTVVMCAEAVPWRCHRSLIADALTVRNIPVQHIMSATKLQPHALTPFAKVIDTRITYPDATNGVSGPRA
jgi:uncharacterized protein (DUF488 family)